MHSRTGLVGLGDGTDACRDGLVSGCALLYDPATDKTISASIGTIAKTDKTGAAVHSLKLLAQATGEYTRDELNKVAKLAWTDKAAAEIAAAKAAAVGGDSNGGGSNGSNAGSESNSGSQGSGSGSENSGSENNGSGSDNNGSEQGGGGGGFESGD